MVRSFAWTVLAFLAAHTLAAPTGNATTTIAPSTGGVVITTFGKTPGLQATFGSEPRGRGTVSILISCTATFFFCIWTAMHPNIIPGISGWRRFYYKAVLMFVSILIPEGVLICAMGQYRDAKALRKAWRASDRIPDNSKHMLDMQVAFFVVMGGFVVDEEELAESDAEFKPTWWQNVKCYLVLWKPKALRSFLKEGIPKIIPPRPRNPRNRCRAILTPSGFRKYLDDGLIHEKTFDRAMIDDKCKANVLSKFLAGGQALWLVAECAVRWKSGLPLTLLEIHVLIQVVRTALIYGFWWEKPLDVNEPIVIKLELAVRDGSPSSKETEPKRFFMTQESMEKEIKATLAYRPNEPDILAKRSPKNYISIDCKVIYDILTQIDIGPREGREDYTKMVKPDDSKLIGDDSKLATKIETKTTKRVGSAYGSSVGMLVESMLVCLTGALHAIAWNSNFPTITEQWLWRISSLAMCFCCLGIFFIANFTEYEQDLIAAVWSFHMTSKGYLWFPGDSFRAINKVCENHAKGENGNRRVGRYICHQLGIWTAIFFVCVYMFSVLYITVESYLSLRSPVHEIFVTQGWIDYWPHL